MLLLVNNINKHQENNRSHDIFLIFRKWGTCQYDVCLHFAKWIQQQSAFLILQCLGLYASTKIGSDGNYYYSIL